MNIVLGIIALGFLVFFHELGHFIVAHIAGVKVESFSVGMGPVILHHTWGGTDYRLSLIPLGGYCGMKGEQDYQDTDNAETAVPDKDSFNGVHPLKRISIALAGPFFNLLFAYTALVVIAMTGYDYYAASTTVRMADEVYSGMQSPAHTAGMQSGDTITAVNGTKTDDFSGILSFIATHPDEDVTISFLRGGKPMQVTVHTSLDKDTGSGKIGVVSDPDTAELRHTQTYPFFSALIQGGIETGRSCALAFKSIGILFKGVDVTKAVSGPVRISVMLGDTMKDGFSAGARTGIAATLELMSFISISLFIMNLLPLPVLDGGLVVCAVIEWIRHRRLTAKTMRIMNTAGIVFIAALFILALQGDIRYLLTKQV